MHNHFDKNLNVKELILDRRPKVLVECGAGSGENTRQILNLLQVYEFSLTTISDGPLHPEWEWMPKELGDGVFKWIHGLSFMELLRFEPRSVDFCSIDTDHNYSTMKKELLAVHPALKAGALLVMHDTETYAKNSGYAGHYGTGHSYDQRWMEAEAEGRGMGDAIHEFLQEHVEYTIIRQSHESHGAMALEKIDA